jgi:outer membrane biosynthesis protein TonB
MRTNVALAAGLCLVLAAGPAAAQNEGRGYGGPLYVGPNFSTGGQSTTPTYDAKPTKKKATVVRERPAPKPRKAPVEKEVATEKASEPAAEKSTTSTVAEKPAADAATSETAATTPATCKRFDSTAGQTITVPCQ